MSCTQQQLLRIIRLCGPLCLSEYMVLCLHHPVHGYYARQNPLGATGDFTTAPEMAQFFGELIGIWLGHMSQAQRPEKSQKPVLAELGPGRGMLLADGYRAMQKIPQLAGFRQDLRIFLLEKSSVLRRWQKDILRFPFTHCEDFSQIPKAPLFLIANEFFDNLPIRQFCKTKNGWQKIMIAATQSAVPSRQAELHFTLAPQIVPAQYVLGDRNDDFPDDSIIETSPASVNLMRMIASHIAHFGGAGLIIDYGKEKLCGKSSFRAFFRQSQADPLKNPGQQDLTANVDFDALRIAGKAGGAKIIGPVNQASFLQALGAKQRVKTLAKTASAQQKENLWHAYDQLTNPRHMGSAFKILAVLPPDAPWPPGFA